MEEPKKKLRGFAAMSPEKQREISSRGGKAAHAQGRAHLFTTEEAREAGRKGGLAPHIRRGAGRGELTEAEAIKRRDPNYANMSPSEQWAEDKQLGLLDYKGES